MLDSSSYYSSAEELWMYILIGLPKQKHSPKVVLEKSYYEKFHKIYGRESLMKSCLS